MHIKAERSQHNNQGIIKLIFDYDREIGKQRQPRARWLQAGESAVGKNVKNI